MELLELVMYMILLVVGVCCLVFGVRLVRKPRVREPEKIELKPVIVENSVSPPTYPITPVAEGETSLVVIAESLSKNRAEEIKP